MAAVERADDGNGNNVYRISAKLVHWVLTSIITGSGLLLVYLVAWAVNEATWKTSTIGRLTAIERDVTRIQIQLESGNLQVTLQRLDEIERRLRQRENRPYLSEPP